MRILIVGSGSREHALAWNLSQEHEVAVSPGNPGIAREFSITASDPLVAAKTFAADLVVVGPENPLIEGLADRLRKAGFPTFGPGAEGARLEGSKAFSKALMADAGIPTAKFQTFRDAAAAVEFARSLADSGEGVVIKASGAALGKGVVVCDDFQQAERAIRQMLVEKVHGAAGDEIVVEERLLGREFSLLTLCSDQGFLSLPVAQDYKRIGDGDVGPNTGGMGTYSPVPWVSDELVAEAERLTVHPLLMELKKRSIQYRGVLFTGLMKTAAGLYCLEYNVRFGDPETQSVMLRLGKGLGDALLACAKGETIPQVERLDRCAVTVVLASRGYPGPILARPAVQIGDIPNGTRLFFAGVGSDEENELIATGGRVISACGIGDTIEQARSLAYQAAQAVRFEGKTYRSDIAI